MIAKIDMKEHKLDCEIDCLNGCGSKVSPRYE